MSLTRTRIVLLIGILALSIAQVDSLITSAARNHAFLLMLQLQRSPALAPREPRLESAQQAFGDLSQAPSDRYHLYARRLDAIIGRWNAAAYQHDATVRAHLTRAHEALEQKQTQAAIDQLRAAADAGPNNVSQMARLLFAALPQAGGEPYYGDPSPIEGIQISSQLPATASCARLQLFALLIDDSALELGNPVHTILVWKSNDSSQDPATFATTWYTLSQGSWRIQMAHIHNLVTDGGFERLMLPREGLLPQLPQPLFTRQTPKHVLLEYETPDNPENLVLRLEGQGQTPVGVGSSPISLATTEPARAFLVTGRYRTVGDAVPRIGIRWLLQDGGSWDDNLSSYVVTETAGDWTHFAGVRIPPDGADQLQYWALNADADSQLHLDNLGLFPIDLPCAGD